MPRIFSHSSFIPASPAAVTSYHADPDNLTRMVMPPLVLQVLRDERTSLTEGEVEFRLWFGPVPVRWVARHAPGPIPTSFRDVQIAGPHKSWAHDHLFKPVQGGTELIDRIAIEHLPGLPGLLTRLFFDGPLLRLLFIYRHRVTRRNLANRVPATRRFKRLSRRARSASRSADSASGPQIKGS